MADRRVVDDTSRERLTAVAGESTAVQSPAARAALVREVRTGDAARSASIMGAAIATVGFVLIAGISVASVVTEGPADPLLLVAPSESHVPLYSAEAMRASPPPGPRPRYHSEAVEDEYLASEYPDAPVEFAWGFSAGRDDGRMMGYELALAGEELPDEVALSLADGTYADGYAAGFAFGCAEGFADAKPDAAEPESDRGDVFAADAEEDPADEAKPKKVRADTTTTDTTTTDKDKADKDKADKDKADKDKADKVKPKAVKVSDSEAPGA